MLSEYFFDAALAAKRRYLEAAWHRRDPAMTTLDDCRAVFERRCRLLELLREEAIQEEAIQEENAHAGVR